MLCWTWLQILYYIYALKALNAVMDQSPERVLVEDGENVDLQCRLDKTFAPCYSVVWEKIDPRTKKMRIVTQSSNSSGNGAICLFTIEKATVQDSGVYYCSVVSFDRMRYLGSGSTVIVIQAENRNKIPAVEILWPCTVQPQIPLLCVISGVVPSQFRVFWVVDGKEDVGFTESLWTKDSGGIVESTQSQILVSADEWERGVVCTCVVEFDGKNTSKSVQNQGSLNLTECVVSVLGQNGSRSTRVCGGWRSGETHMLLYGTLAGAGLTFIVGISIAVVLHFGYSVKSDGDAREQRRDTGLENRQQRSGRKGRRSGKDRTPSASDVTYASLQEASLARRM